MLQAADLALSAEECLELDAIRAESIGWIPLTPGAYVHQGACDDETGASVIEVVGIASAQMAGINVIWLI